MHFIPILSYDFGSYCWLDVPSASVCDIFKAFSLVTCGRAVVLSLTLRLASMT